MTKGIYKRKINPINNLGNFSKKGNHLSEEHKKKLSEIKKGEMPKNIEILKSCNVGRKHTEEHKKKNSEAHKGKIGYWRNKKRLELTGINHWKWVKDRNLLQKYNNTNKDRISSIYRNWRLEVYKRDNFKCRINNQDCMGKIIAHHILSYTDFPELRYEINNGITLC